MFNIHHTLEELLNFNSKLDLLESRTRKQLLTDYTFDSNSYFNSIEELLNEHKTKISKIRPPICESNFTSVALIEYLRQMRNCLGKM